MNEPDRPIEKGLLAALRADRNVPAPADARARLAQRMSATPAPNGSGHGGPASAGAGGAPATLSTAVVWSKGAVILAFALGGVGGAALHASLARPPEPRIVYVDRPVSSAAPALAMVASVPVPATSVLSDPPSSSGPLRSGLLRSPPIPSGTASQLDAERDLLDSVRADLAAGNATAALTTLHRHADTFPHPMLAEEREALMIEALVRAARYDEARKRAVAFRSQSPGSLFQPAIDAALATIP
jgi:hypothetical protein